MDDNNELTIYILQQLRYGIPEQTIRQALAQNGWPQPLVDRAFSMVLQAASRGAAPTVQRQPSSVQSANLSLPAAELPQPAVEPNVMQTPNLPPKTEKPKRPSGARFGRRLFIVLLILVLLIGATVGGFLIYKAVKDHSARSAKTSSQTKPNTDTQRKSDINTIATNLTSYYEAKQTYPTIDQVNAADFASSEKGFDITRFKDPDWTKKAGCVSEQGTPIFAADRTDSCYSYRVTAPNGADCNADNITCTRVVLTASLTNNKPYIVALDRNSRE